MRSPLNYQPQKPRFGPLDEQKRDKVSYRFGWSYPRRHINDLLAGNSLRDLQAHANLVHGSLLGGILAECDRLEEALHRSGWAR
jgi:hypothetical protein